MEGGCGSKERKVVRERVLQHCHIYHSATLEGNGTSTGRSTSRRGKTLFLTASTNVFDCGSVSFMVQHLLKLLKFLFQFLGYMALAARDTINVQSYRL